MISFYFETALYIEGDFFQVWLKLGGSDELPVHAITTNILLLCWYGKKMMYYNECQNIKVSLRFSKPLSSLHAYSHWLYS